VPVAFGIRASSSPSVALTLEPLIAEQAKARQATSTGGSDPQLLQKSEKVGRVHTHVEIAKVADVSHDTDSTARSFSRCDTVVIATSRQLAT
jgi:hypothetical protein